MTKQANTTSKQKSRKNEKQVPDRKLVGVRLEPRFVKVIKGISELHDCTLGELIEQVIWMSMEGENFFAGGPGRIPADTKKRLQDLKAVYDVDYDLDYLKPSKNS